MTAPAPHDVIPPPQTLAKPNQTELLSVVSFQLSTQLRITTFDKEHVVVKYEPGRTYLALSPAQWKVLQSFAQRASTVPQVLFELISSRRCIPLREFYEIILKAHERGILQAVGEPARPEVPATTWASRASGRKVRTMVIVAAVGAVVAMVLRPFALPVSALELAAGWAIACATTSLGYLLAACVARDEDAEIYQPHWHGRTLFPHYRVDVDDAVMGGRETVVNVAMARLAPLIVAMGIVPFLHPGISFLLFCTFIFHLSPFWWSPGLRFLHGRYGSPILDAFRSFLFTPNRNAWFALRSRLRAVDIKFLNIHLGMTVGWLVLVLLAGSLPLRANALELWQAYTSANGLHFTALAMLTLLGLMVVGSTLTGMWLLSSAIATKLGPFLRRTLPVATVAVSPELLEETVRESLLFKGFSREERARIAATARPLEVTKDTMVVREGEVGSTVYIVHSGKVEVLRDTDSGRREWVATLERGDVFGERALLETSGRRTRSVRATSNCVLLEIERSDFEALVLSRLNRTQIEDILQKVAFLDRIDLSATWSPQAMFSFAQRAIIQSFDVGETLIRANDDNQYFFLLYEGELSVRQNQKEVARLRSGDFFGEISVLQNSTATATIVVRTPAKCLVVAKREFLQFLVNDFYIGLHFEQISSSRLGEPIFPLQGRSFDVIRG
ncbi:cyclic nucleotide-binding domain-containing protein [Synoicihabitans lomoniglobus]|uniref:Cyclic nucleotide-binding domain-containing protein n=1 Tax=Synoicihabitans lomoniglobus TaxID=2909285 RepID=A0AAF0I1W8_9BACT|nr:cyclic nucleotide-binding domain-containing protein [Opitutaceae bacterium LMO-M01]WED66087.1 cyclic nucleotide-binding domain-containing protein [Opitutaceae bacterium LMO-M01]